MKTKPFVSALSIALGVICIASPVFAQSTFGTILGTVTDASDAVMPNIVVKVTNQGEGITREVRTDAQGTYRAENLKDGLYTVKVQAEGFREVTVQDIRLTARQIVRTDLKLVVGSTTEKVEVVANAELISTETQTISASVTSTEVLNLPANYRGAGSTSPYSLLAYLPGVTGDQDGNISVQGTGINQVEYSMDGISTTNIRSSGPQIEMFPSAESIAEMKVQGSGGGAEYGNPADITTTSKSGTNVFHGSAFEYFQNAALDATRFTVPQVEKPAKSANTFGGSLGGPIFKNRTFFFGDYEGMRYRTQTVRQETVPSQAMRDGDFSGFCAHYDANQICDVTDPNLPNLQLHHLDGTPYPGNIIPMSEFDPRAPAILQYYPLPIQGGVNNFQVRNHTLNVPNPTLSDQFDIRIDHTINTKQNVFGRWTYKNTRLVSPSGLGLPAENDFEHDNQIVIAHNYAITPNLVNELRGGISRRQNGGNFPIDGPAFMEQLGLNSQQLGPFPPGGFPDFVFEPRDGNIDAIVHTRPNPELSHNFQINENLTWTKGKHTMKFGFDLRKLHLITAWYSGSSSADDYGDFFFNGQYTGHDFADFLLGVPYYTYVTHTPPRNIDGTATHYYAYAADTFRATKKLTLDFGLRISRIPPLYDPINLTNFDPSVPITGRVIISSDPRSLAATQPLWAQAVNACNDPNNVNPSPGPPPCTPFLTAKQAGWPKQLRKTYTDFGPRVGFAYRPFADNKTVVRGGIGIYDVATLGAIFNSVAGIHDGFQANYSNTGFGDAGFFQFPNVQDPSRLALGTQSFFTANRMDKKDPYSIQWNLSVERELHGNTALRVSYIANRANQLTWSPNLNQAPIVAGQVGPTPYPAWNKVRIRTSGAISTYESMQTELIHKYSHGLTLQSTWTWARNLADSESWPRSGFSGEITGDAMNQYNLRGDYGNVGGTRKHRWITTMVAELPIGKGRYLLGDAHGVLNAIVGGWRLSNIFLVQSGPFDTPFLKFDSSGNAVNNGFNRPDLAGNPNNVHHTRTQWWNPNVFACPGGEPGQDFTPGTVILDCSQVIGRFGNAAVGSLVGPGTVNLSLGLAKDFRLTERFSLKFETSFTNLPNHPNWDDPRNNLSESGDTGNGSFGQVLATRIGDAGGNRVGQFALRLEF
jgi:hypothetical protein